MHAAHYLRELGKIVRSDLDEVTDTWGNPWVRRDGVFVCESAELVASLAPAGDGFRVEVTPVEW